MDINIIHNTPAHIEISKIIENPCDTNAMYQLGIKLYTSQRTQEAKIILNYCSILIDNPFGIENKIIKGIIDDKSMQ